MKRMMLLMLMILGVLSACSDDDDDSASVSFSKEVYILNGDASVDIVLNASKAVSSAMSVKFTVAGTAAEDEDYTLSAHEFTFAAGSNSAKVTVEPKDNFTEGQTIRLTLGEVPGYTVKGAASVVVTVVPKEIIIAGFTTDETELASTREVKVSFRGAVNKDYTSSRELHIPFTVGGTAVLGTHYEIVGNASGFVVPAGQREASVTLKFLALEEGKDEIILKLNEEPGIQMGNNESVSIQITGPTSFADMVGKWEYNGEFASEEWITSILTEEYPGDEVNLPTPSSSSGTIEFLSADIDSMIMNLSGSLANYFRSCKVTYLKDVPDEELIETPETIKAQVMYMELSSANVNFSASHTTLRPALILFRFLNNARTELQIRIVDYEPTDFMTQTWEDWNDGSDYPLKDYLPLCFNFTKVN